MPQVPELKGLMVEPAGARQGRFEYTQTQSDKTAQKYFADAASAAVELTGRQMRAQKKAHDDMVDARATELANQFYQYGTEITVGKDGALRKFGADVVKPKDGQPFTQTYVSLLENRANEIISSVDDVEVAKKAREKINNYGRQFQAQIISHEGAQNYEYVKTQAAAGVEVAANNIRIRGAGKNTIEALRSAMIHQADIGGMDTKDPMIRSAIDAELRTKSSQSVKESVVGFVDRGDLISAERAYLSAANADALTMEDRHNLRTLIKTAKEERLVSDTAGNTMMWLTTKRTPGFVASSIAFGDKLADASVLSFTGVQVPEGAETNSALRATTNAKVMENLTDRFGSTEAALAAVTIGVERMEGAIETGGAGGWESVLTPTEKAAITKATKKYDYDVGLKTAPTDSEIRASILSVSPSMSPDVVEKTLKETKARIAMEEVRRDTMQTQAANTVVQAYQSGGSLSDVPYSVRSSLTDAQRAAATALFQRDPGKAFAGGSKFYMNLVDNPEALKNMKDADFNLVVRSQTSDEEFAALASRRNHLRGMESFDATASRDRVVNAVNAYGRQMFGAQWDKNDDEMRYKKNVIIDEAVRMANDVARQTVGVGGAKKGLTDDGLASVVTSVFTNRLNVAKGWVSSRSNVSWFDLTVDGLPSNIKDMGTQLAVAKYGTDKPSEQQVLSAVLHDVILDPKNTVDANVVKWLYTYHGDELADIQSVFEKNRGVQLDDAALLRVWVLKNMDDQAWYDASGLSRRAPVATTSIAAPAYGEDGMIREGTMMD